MMLEDQLREMFQARVSEPLSAQDPGGVALQRGRQLWLRRRFMILTTSFIVFAAMLASAVVIKALVNTVTQVDTVLTYEGIFGEEVDQPARSGVSLPVVSVPIDVYVGTALWTAEGNRFTLSGVDHVIEVIRVPAGWLYSDDIRLRLLTLSGSSVPIRDNISSWAVSPDGQNLASVVDGTKLETRATTGGKVTKETIISGAVPHTFEGTRVVFRHPNLGYGYRDKWVPELIGVYGSSQNTPVGLVREGNTTCLTDLIATDNGWQLGQHLGCGDIIDTAARGAYGRVEPVRSPDGRMLAVPSAVGVHVIDIHASRKAGPGATPIAIFTCPSASDAPAVWADSRNLLTITKAGGIIACGTDGSRSSVPLPAGVTDGWALVPRFGLSS